MIEMIAVMGILFVMVGISIYFAVRPCVVKEKRRMCECKKEELVAILLEKSKQMRICQNYGNGIDCSVFYREAEQTERMIKRKVNKKIPLNDAEIWYYENFYLLRRFVFAGGNDLKKVPHVGNEPRILKIARIIVDNSLETLNPDRIKFVMDNIKSAFNFTYREIKKFNRALGIAISEQLFILSQRLKYAENCKIQAKKIRFDKNYLTKDVYLYYLLQKDDISDKTVQELRRMGIEKGRVICSYNYVMMKNTAMARTLFGALRDLDALLPVTDGIGYLGAYEVLNRKNSLNSVSIDTLCAYFNIIDKIAARTASNENYIAEKLVLFADYNAKDISEILFDYCCFFVKYIKKDELRKVSKKKNLGESVYVLCIVSCAAVLAVGLGIWLRSVVFGVLSAIPLFFAMENMINYLLSNICVDFSTPSMCYEKIPYEHSAMIVVSEYISSVEQLKKSIFHAETLLSGNYDENVSVGILIDTPSDTIPVTDLDREIIEYVSQNVFPKNLHVYLRKKSYLKKKFIAKERKRGAIMALAKYFITKEDFEFLFISEKEGVSPRYLILLDADNTVLPGEALSLINKIAHPYNRKYDLLAMRGRTNLHSLKNVYSLRYLEESGFEQYPDYTGLYYKLFRADIYCGKGITSVENFYNKLEEVFPSGKILSHDVIEGSILKTGSGGMCFEDAPENFISDRERKKRWMRGDIQLLPFLFGFWKNDGNKRYKGSFSPLSRLIMLKNVIATVTYACVLSLFLLGICTSSKVLICAASVFFLPYVINQIKIFRRSVCGDRFLSIIRQSATNLLRAVEDFFLTGYYAIDNLCVLVSTLFRMILGKKLLEWKTYYSSQKARSFASYLRLIAFPTLVLTIIMGILMFFGNNILPCAIYIFSMLLTLEGLYCSSRILLKDKNVSENGKKELRELASETYKYFCFMRSKSGLIADNFQLKPYKGQSKTTSPTNIGFSILAEICAFLIDIISYEECVLNVKTIIDALSKLKKWHGNLYNWYNIDSCEPADNFVSGVDNGNLAVILLLGKIFFAEKGNALLASEFEFILASMRLDKLYDANKKLFYIGYDGKKFCGHYDLLASEARILSLVYSALYHDYTHFYKLKKDYTNLGGNVLLSWSGTMFEMLMPEIFFAAPHFSTLYNSEKYTVKRQIKEKIGKVWGISESGKYEFDENMLYQYSAFGIKDLAINSITADNVVTPYASILGLRFYPQDVIDNIEEFKKIGCSFEYGLFEAADFGNVKRIVCSAMSHHQGMILAAITNILTDNSLKKILKKSPEISSCIEYFNEKIPNSIFPRKSHEKPRNHTKTEYKYSKKITNVEQLYLSAALSDAQYTVICNGLGGGWSKFGDILINKNNGIYEENNGMYFFATTDGKQWNAPSFLPFAHDDTSHEFGYSEKEIFYTSSNGLEEKITVMPMLNCEVRKLKTSEKYNEAAFYFDLCLDRSDDYEAHPVFRNLFASVKQISSDTVLVEKRFPRQNGKKAFLGVRVFGAAEIIWECNKINFIGRGNTLSNARFLFDCDNAVDHPSVGDVLTPCVGFRAKLLPEKHECTVCVMYAESENFILQTLSSLTDSVYDYALNSTGRIVFTQKFNEMIGDLCYALPDRGMLKNVVESGKIKQYRNYTSDKKILQYDIDVKRPEKIKQLIDLIKDLRIIGINVKTAIYSIEELSKNIREYVEKSFCENLVTDYIFISGLCEEKYRAFIEADSDLNFKKKPFTFSVIFSAELRLNGNFDDVFLPDKAFASGNGFFDENGDYIVTEKTLAPYTDVIGGKKGGIVATCDGGGFYYFGNSREDKCIRFDNDPVEKSGGERFFVKTTSCFVDIFCTGKGRFCIVGKGEIACHTFCEEFNSITSHYTVLDGEVKISEVRISKKKACYLDFLYAFYPSAGSKYDPFNTVFIQNGNVFCVKNIVTDKGYYVKVIGGDNLNTAIISDTDTVPYFELSCEKTEERFYIVSARDLAIIYSLNEENIRFFAEKSREYFHMLSDIDITTKEKSFNYFVNFLPYQIISSRINARAGFYQVGGATGYRDRLQDSLAFFTRPEIIKECIEAACIHQYEEGDVMHWWHEPKFGLRTRITDDKLFLPYAVCKYIEYVGDEKILDEEYCYLHSEPLRPTERDRLENPPYTDYKERVFSHCIRAIRSALKYGRHRLLVMGSGDWNDGMDAICEKGRGESVFNSMFAYLVLTEFSQYCPTDLQAEMRTIAYELKEAINAHAFETDRYKRLFSDDGRWLGSSLSDALQLDLLTQAFAVISGVADKERAEKCLKTADLLIDKIAGIIKLLSPPLTQDDYLGYISDYPKGVRENGGQYTHAAIWYLIALTKIGKADEAYELFQMINPIEKCRDPIKNKQYACEPYVLCGDVYSNGDNYGHGGWSWYTGSAAWAYKLVTEYFFGLKRRGNKLYIEPTLPQKLVGAVVCYRYKNSVFLIEYQTGLFPKITIDGEVKEYIELMENVRKSVVVDIGC